MQIYIVVLSPSLFLQFLGTWKTNEPSRLQRLLGRLLCSHFSGPGPVGTFMQRHILGQTCEDTDSSAAEAAASFVSSSFSPAQPGTPADKVEVLSPAERASRTGAAVAVAGVNVEAAGQEIKQQVLALKTAAPGAVTSADDAAVAPGDLHQTQQQQQQAPPRRMRLGTPRATRMDTHEPPPLGLDVLPAVPAIACVLLAAIVWAGSAFRGSRGRNMGGGNHMRMRCRRRRVLGAAKVGDIGQ
jgi:hypothetical protein